MSVADKITQLGNDISASYLKIEGKGGTVPANKNTTNLPDAIDSIPSGGAVVIEPIEITENGTYTASEGVDGYSPIEVNVQGASLPTKGFVFENYDSDGYPTAGRFVGEWSGELPRFEHFFKPIAYGRSVTSLTIPEGITIISASSLASCSSLKTILLPKTVTTIQTHAFFASGVTSITIPESFTSWGNGINHFNGSSLITVIFEGHCPDIPKNCFWKCNNINYFDFSNCTSVPTLYSAGSLGHASGCVIKVPSALLSEWQNATNWVDLTDVVWEGV